MPENILFLEEKRLAWYDNKIILLISTGGCL